MKPQFTQDWTSHHFPVWEKHLGHLRAKDAPQGLELGSYEGRSAIWFLENILTHARSNLVCIDMWANGDIYGRFLSNLVSANVHDRCDIRRGDTHKLTRNIKRSFDFIYIDADHSAEAVLSDACSCWPILKPGGIMIFDDYLWTAKDPEDTRIPPKDGIDAFLSAYRKSIEVLHREWQVIVRKLP